MFYSETFCPQDYHKHFINFKNDMITSSPWNSCQVTAVISALKRTTNDRDMNWAIQSRFILPIKEITSGEIQFGLQSRCNEILAIKLKIQTINSHLKLTSWGELLHPQPKTGAGVQQGSNAWGPVLHQAHMELCCPVISAGMMGNIYNIEDVKSIYVTYSKHLTVAVIKPSYHSTAQSQLC